MEGTLSLFDWRPSPAPGPGDVTAAQRVDPVPTAASTTHPRIIVFDCETTGTDRTSDQVIELCVQQGLEDDAPSKVWRIKPAVAIHPGALAVHGISMADLEACPAFAEVADEITSVFAEAEVIVGYNLAFDIDMLQAEYCRIGRPLLDLSGKQIVDAFRLWQQCEPRSLQHAHQRFVGNGFAAAHSASADVAATGRVLSGMLRAFALDGQDWAQIASVCDPGRASWVGPSRHLRWEGDVIVLGFGKHGGTALHELASSPDRSFLRWVLERPPGKDFPPHVVEICRAALDQPSDQFLEWARTRFGGHDRKPAPAAQTVVTPVVILGDPITTSSLAESSPPRAVVHAASASAVTPRARKPRAVLTPQSSASFASKVPTHGPASDGPTDGPR